MTTTLTQARDQLLHATSTTAAVGLLWLGGTSLTYQSAVLLAAALWFTREFTEWQLHQRFLHRLGMYPLFSSHPGGILTTGSLVDLTGWMAGVPSILLFR